MKVMLTKRLQAILPDYFLYRDYCGKFHMTVGEAVCQRCLPFASQMSPDEFERLAKRALRENPILKTINYAKRFVVTATLDMQLRSSNPGFRFHPDSGWQLTDDMQIFTAKEMSADPYLANIKIPEAASGRFRLTTTTYEPYELFTYDVSTALPYGFDSPHIGFFEEWFSAPALAEDDSAWMTITPNEICTMKEHIQIAKGKVLTLGCGLGYFAYMASLKDSVDEITIIERSPDVIKLFTEHILPQFDQKEKIRIIQGIFNIKYRVSITG